MKYSVPDMEIIIINESNILCESVGFGLGHDENKENQDRIDMDDLF